MTQGRAVGAEEQGQARRREGDYTVLVRPTSAVPLDPSSDNSTYTSKPKITERFWKHEP